MRENLKQSYTNSCGSLEVNKLYKHTSTQRCHHQQHHYHTPAEDKGIIRFIVSKKAAIGSTYTADRNHHNCVAGGEDTGMRKSSDS